MDVILSAIKDVLKYKVISQTNTGDKTLDNLYNTLFIAVLTILFAKSIWVQFYTKIKELYCRIKGFRQSRVLTEQNYEFYETKCLNGSFMYCTWYLEQDKKFTTALSYYITKNFRWKLGYSSALLYNMVEMKIIERYRSDDISVVRELIVNNDKLFPVFITSTNEIIALVRVNDTIYIAYESPKALKDFCEMIKDYKVDFTGGQKKDTRVKMYYWPSRATDDQTDDQTDCFPIYTDRCFDTLVTRHKKRLIHALDDFIMTNKTCASVFNGFGTYNLGIMLYGKPGTGKTLTIKAVCNYLKRSAVVIDMRKIKTKSTFVRLFTKWPIKEYVFVLEELDCIEGVVTDRKMKRVDQKDEIKNTAEKLRETYQQTLQMRAVATESSSQRAIDKELAVLQTQMTKNEDSLTLDTMLTILDGVEEMRGRCIIGTTNYIDRLDHALIREGRFDHKLALDEFNDTEIREFLTKIFAGNAEKKEWEYMHNCRFREGKFTPVKIVNLCHQHRKLSKVAEMLSTDESPMTYPRC